MIDFYIKYLKLDSVGTISNNHLHQSDQYGLNSEVFNLVDTVKSLSETFRINVISPKMLTLEIVLSNDKIATFQVCMNLAKKNSQAVDFTKTGQPPQPLIKIWKEDENGVEIPPERAERVPDYHFGNEFNPIYISPRLCGKIYR